MLLLEVEPLDLGADIRALGLELVEPGTREPVRGPEAAAVWARILPALAASETWSLDFPAHPRRVREYCTAHGIVVREAADSLVVLPAPQPNVLSALLERFESEILGLRAGGPLRSGDAPLEAEIARRGLDAYQPAFSRYAFCGIAEFESGSLTLLSNSLSSSEVIRRLRPVLTGLEVEVKLAA